MRSMTGFGIGEADTSVGRLGLEIRTVNHRYLDVRVRPPKDLSDLAAFIEQLVREKISRGRVDISMFLEPVAQTSVLLDVDRARAAYSALRSFRDEVDPSQPVPLSLLSMVPNLFVLSAESNRAEIKKGCQEAFERALVGLESMRTMEGKALRTDLEQRMEKLRTLLASISDVAPLVIDHHLRKLRTRVEKMLNELPGHASRLEAARIDQEIVLLTDRLDFSEELTRLDSHLAQFAAQIETSQPIGRQLDFLLQEMHRELNTLGSKAQDAKIAHWIVDAKTELERMREQVQNVE